MATYAKPGNITVMDPTAVAIEAEANMAPRLSSLDGKVLGLLDNSKHNASALLKMVGDLFSDQFELKDIKFASKLDASRPVPKETVQKLAAESDFAVVAIGD